MRVTRKGIGRRVSRLFDSGRKPQTATGIVRLTPEKAVSGRVLMSYATQVYLNLLAGEEFDRTHISAWQNFNMARTFLDLGFEVDVFNFEDSGFLPNRSYDVAIDIVSNLGRIGENQPDGLIKILFPMFAHWTEHNFRSYARHRSIAHRRGASIKPKRLITPNDAVEQADVIFCKGGEFGQSTYSYSDTTVIPLIQSGPNALDEFVSRDVGHARNNFVWLGGSSAVHKGLDLVLEAFAELPQLNLTVIGKVPEERQFAEVYRKELFEMPNIQAVGWMDTLSDEFRQVISRSVAIVAPSATEMSCGSVIAGMMSGLIPIVTEGADIDVSGIGFNVREDSVDGVRQAILELESESDGSLADLSRAAWEARRQRYGKQKFLDSFRTAVCGALGVVPAPEWETDDPEPRIPKIELVGPV